MAVGAVQNQKSSLQYTLRGEDVEKARKQIEANKTYQDLFNDPKKVADMEKALSKGHGGAVERYVQKHTAVAENFNENNPKWLSPKKPPLPQSFAEAKAEVQKLADSKTPVNPYVRERQLLASFYYANAENNPNLSPETIHQNVEGKMDAIKKEGTFSYMMETQSPEVMNNHVLSGAKSANMAFGTAQAIRIQQRHIKEAEELKKNMQAGENQPENEQEGPQMNPV